MSEVYVGSEINRLERVLIHRPDSGIARVAPGRASELLFDDIVHLPRIREEHLEFENVLNAFVGQENVLEAEDLIRESLSISYDIKKELVDLIKDFEELPTVFRDEMLELPDDALAKTLITGYIEESDTILFDPIPNFIFTRDIAIVVKDHVVITKAAKQARHRENLLTRFMFWTHPIFNDLKDQNRIINLNLIEDFPPSRRGEVISMEGGDMMIVGNEFLLIGVSERSSEHAFNSLKDALFERGCIEHVAKVRVPADRSFMHIDTVFTRINHDEMLAFKPIVLDGMSSNVDVYSSNGLHRAYPSIKEFVHSEINSQMKFIQSGNGVSPYQEREQWTDSCNLLAVKPGVAIAYDRNTRTEVALKEHGYQIMKATEFIEQYKDNPDLPNTIEKTIITLSSGELSRARGGSHCMSCPIRRSK